eukprot:TRINITY_DN17151_c0_g1_i1.p1 TRINITY_DN17151_c0_g1~~TRINITY_DN17151_c0_g1_i1.p1  ORF type:complete len:118 (-),score=39.82 TRINITY_DN17151_c0_g1_i1:65-418(-)
MISTAMFFFFFFQAEDGIRDAQESRGLGDVYKRQILKCQCAKDDLYTPNVATQQHAAAISPIIGRVVSHPVLCVDTCLLYTSDAADEEDSVDLGGRRIIKKKKKKSNVNMKIEKLNK